MEICWQRKIRLANWHLVKWQLWFAQATGHRGGCQPGKQRSRTVDSQRKRQSSIESTNVNNEPSMVELYWRLPIYYNSKSKQTDRQIEFWEPTMPEILGEKYRRQRQRHHRHHHHRHRQILVGIILLYLPSSSMLLLMTLRPAFQCHVIP